MEGGSVSFELTPIIFFLSHFPRSLKEFSLFGPSDILPVGMSRELMTWSLRSLSSSSQNMWVRSMCIKLNSYCSFLSAICGRVLVDKREWGPVLWLSKLNCCLWGQYPILKSPGYSASDSASYWCGQERSSDVCSRCPCQGGPGWTLAGPKPICCWPLGSNPVDRRSLSFLLSLTLCHSNK